MTVAPYVDWSRLDWVTVLRAEALPSPGNGRDVVSLLVPPVGR